MKPLDKMTIQEKEILKIILSDADKEGLSPESIQKYNNLKKNWNKPKEIKKNERPNR